MILHCVFLRFRNAVQQPEKDDLYAAISALREVTPGILDVKSGANISPEGLNGGFLDGFTVTFESIEARDAYLVHPDHVAVAQRLLSAIDGGTSGVLVFDMAV